VKLPFRVKFARFELGLLTFAKVLIMNKIFGSLCALLTVVTASAQHEYSSFTTTGRGGATSFVTDYQAVGINPANLGWTWRFEDKKVAFGLMENTFSIHSQALSKQDLRSAFWGSTKGLINPDKRDTTNKLTYDQRMDAARDFTGSGFAINSDIGLFGFAFTHPKIGGIGFRVNMRNQFYSRLGKTASELLFLGRTAPYFDSLMVYDGVDTTTIANVAGTYDPNQVVSGFRGIPQMFNQILDGTLITFNSYVDYNLSYGHKVFEIDSVVSLYAGIGLKYVQGMGFMEIESKDGQLTAFSALTPAIPIDYGAAATLNPSAITQKGFFPNAVGRGFGIDLGLNAVILNRIKVAAAYTNAGTVTWDGNVYTVKDTLLFDTDNPGLESYSLFQSLGSFAGESGLLEWNGVATRKVQLPSLFRFGASVDIIPQKLELGFDAIFPTNNAPGQFERAMLGFGGDVRPIKWLELSAGFLTGGNYDFMVPLGITVFAPAGGYEFGIASRDALTFFLKNGPTISWSVGFLRFRL
jgi:hypothetical protein